MAMVYSLERHALYNSAVILPSRRSCQTLAEPNIAPKLTA